MKLNFKFTNLFGTAYKCGNLVFTENGSGLLSPVGNQVTVYDLKRDEVITMQINSCFDISHIVLSPCLSIMVAINSSTLCVANNYFQVGEASICSLVSGSIVSVYSFRHVVLAAAFSPNGRYLAVAKGHYIIVYFAPSMKRFLNNLELYRVFYGFSDNILNIDWSTDSNYFLAGSVDNSCRVFSIHRNPKLIIYTLSGHKNPVISSYFFENTLDCVSVSSDGNLCLWEADTLLQTLTNDNNGNDKVLFKLIKRFHYFDSSDTKIQTPITTTAFHKKLKLFATGFENGLMMLHKLPDFTIISEVNLFAYSISSLAISPNGDWIAAGSDVHGQLTVWEWRSQTCYLRFESHAKEMTSMAYSPDGLHIVTGGYDSKVKVWNVSGGRSVVTFSEHTSAVTGVAFPLINSKVIVSASLDGTVRAHDLNRYRNFRTFTVPTRRVQFASLAVDVQGSLVASGSLDTFEAYIWSMKTGQLLSTLTGHTSPISSLAFNPDINSLGIELASVSWDANLRIWDISGDGSDDNNLSSMGLTKEVVNFTSDALCVAYRSDGKQLAICFINGNIVFYDPNEGVEMGTIDGHRDLGVTQTEKDDLVTPVRAAQGRKFQTIAYSIDGEHLLAAGDSKYICLYSVPDCLLLKRFEVTCNLSLEGVQEIHDRRHYLGQISLDAREAKAAQRPSLRIPTSRKGDDLSRRQWRPEVRVSSLQFSPTGDSFAATSTEGVLVYLLASSGSGVGFGLLTNQQLQPAGWLFDTMGIDEEVTPSNVRLAIDEGRQFVALDMAIRLQLHHLVEEVLENIPVDQIDYLVHQLPIKYIIHFMITFLARQLDGRSRHVELYLHWTDAILRTHGLELRNFAANAALNQKNALKKMDNDDDDTDEMTKKAYTDLTSPGFLTIRGEWALCQANLVRLQSSLVRVKSHLINRFNSVDNLWNYLDAVSKINNPKFEEKEIVEVGQS